MRPEAAAKVFTAEHFDALVREVRTVQGLGDVTPGLAIEVASILLRRRYPAGVQRIRADVDRWEPAATTVVEAVPLEEQGTF